jgi:hypothetical protein
MEKRIDNERWAFQLKYSTQVTKRCESEVEGIEEF